MMLGNNECHTQVAMFRELCTIIIISQHNVLGTVAREVMRRVPCRTFIMEVERCAEEPERLGGIFIRYVRLSWSPSNKIRHTELSSFCVY